MINLFLIIFYCHNITEQIFLKENHINDKFNHQEDANLLIFPLTLPLGLSSVIIST